MNLLFITFGKNVAIHAQAAFSIYSFLVHKKIIDSINIITDAPHYYQHLKEYVQVVPVTEDQLNEWKGPHQFFWRIKIKAIEKICNQYLNKPVVYLDTDTFLYEDANALTKDLLTTAFMHEEENILSKGRSKTENKMWQQVGLKTFGGIKVKESASMWNAGVVAIPNTKNGEDVSTALAICDDMCAAGVTPRLIEQFALSIALEHYYILKPASPFIAHYWSNKSDWDKEINEFFAACYFQQLVPQQIIEVVRDYNFSKYPVKKLNRNTAKRLNNYINDVFAPRNIEYVSKEKN